MKMERNLLAQYVREIRCKPLLNHEDEVRLAAAAQAGCKASRDAMVESNLRLVVSVAKQFVGRGVDILDLISAGNTGLMHAITKYDTTSGFRFSTYAVQWIRERIQREYMNHGNTIRIPIHMHDNLAQMGKATRTLAAMQGGHPSDRQLVELTGLPEKKVRSILRAGATKAAPWVHTEEEETDPLALVPDDALAPHEETEQEREYAHMLEALEKLNPRERQVLALRFGLCGDEELTLDEVGRAIGVTRERVRQIQIEALAKLRRRLQPPGAIAANG